MACWTELMRLVNDPDTILASSAAKRAVVRLKMADCTRKHIWDTTEKKEKKDTDSLAEHVRHAAPRMDPRSDAPSSPRPQPNPPDPEQVRFVAKPLEIEAKHSDPLRRYLREGVTSREDVPAQFARAWGTRESKLDPLGLVHRLCTPAHLHLADPPPLHRCIPDPPRPCPSGEFARDGEPRQLPAPRRGGDSACDAAGRRLRRRPRCVLLVATRAPPRGPPRRRPPPPPPPPPTLPPPYPHPTHPTLNPTPPSPSTQPHPRPPPRQASTGCGIRTRSRLPTAPATTLTRTRNTTTWRRRSWAASRRRSRAASIKAS
jgi:hypothetical protein